MCKHPIIIIIPDLHLNKDTLKEILVDYPLLSESVCRSLIWTYYSPEFRSPLYYSLNICVFLLVFQIHEISSCHGQEDYFTDQPTQGCPTESARVAKSKQSAKLSCQIPILIYSLTKPKFYL